MMNHDNLVQRFGNNFVQDKRLFSNGNSITLDRFKSVCDALGVTFTIESASGGDKDDES